MRVSGSFWISIILLADFSCFRWQTFQFTRASPWSFSDSQHFPSRSDSSLNCSNALGLIWWLWHIVAWWFGFFCYWSSDPISSFSPILSLQQTSNRTRFLHRPPVHSHFIPYRLNRVRLQRIQLTIRSSAYHKGYIFELGESVNHGTL